MQAFSALGKENLKGGHPSTVRAKLPSDYTVSGDA
jgi:hypothetical protein